MKTFKQANIDPNIMWDNVISRIEKGQLLVPAVIEAVLKVWPSDAIGYDTRWERLHTLLAPEVEALDIIRSITKTRVLGPIEDKTGWCDTYSRDEWIDVIKLAKTYE